LIDGSSTQIVPENRFAPEDVLGIYESTKYLYRFIFYEDLVRKTEIR